MTQRKIIASTPLYEIMDERDAPRRLGRGGATTSILQSIRGAIEAAYVSLAGGAMLRAEQMEDARAGRPFASRRRKAERQRLRHEPS